MDNPSVKYAPGLMIDAQTRAELASLAFSATGTRRLCFHRSPEAPLHIMLVESRDGSEYPPHAHTDGDEVIVVIEGMLKLTTWERPERAMCKITVLQPPAPLAFIPRGTKHQTAPYLGPCTYLEVKLGPFRPDALRVYK